MGGWLIRAAAKSAWPNQETVVGDAMLVFVGQGSQSAQTGSPHMWADPHDAHPSQVCTFFKLDVPELRDNLYLCALRCLATSEGRFMLQHQRKRLRNTTSDGTDSQGGERLLYCLQGKPDIAEAVLTAARAHESSTPLSLAQLCDALPNALHASAARGFYGASAAEWWLDATQASALRASNRTVQVCRGSPASQLCV